MNRKERRKIQKHQGVRVAPPRTYTLTDVDLQRIKSKAVDDALRALLAIPVMVLHDKYGFGEVRLSRFMGYVNTWIKAIHEDENTLAELIDLAEKEAGFKIELR